MNETFEQLTHELDALYGLPGVVLTLLFCIGIGYFLKLMQFFPNKWIPLPVVCWGVLWNILLRPPPAPGVAPWQHYCRLAAVGFLIGLTACILYDKILSKLEDHWPWLKDFLSTPESDKSPPPKL